MPRSPTRHRRSPTAALDLFSAVRSVEVFTPRPQPPGNYATRTVRKWIRGDPAAVDACRQLARDTPPTPTRKAKSRDPGAPSIAYELARRLAAWFVHAVRTEEPSAVYADYLCGSIDVEWEMLADEFLAETRADRS